MIIKALKQMLHGVVWAGVDTLVIDLPPGTGDVQLTLLQKIPLTSTVVVTTPQNVSVSDCKKGIEMIKRLSIPILGLIENMSWFQPIDSEKKYFLFGQDGGKDLAAEYKIDLLAQLPLIEKEDKKELHELDEIKAYFEILTDKIIELIKEVRAKKVDSIPQTNVTK